MSQIHRLGLVRLPSRTSRRRSVLKLAAYELRLPFTGELLGKLFETLERETGLEPSTVQLAETAFEWPMTAVRTTYIRCQARKRVDKTWNGPNLNGRNRHRPRPRSGCSTVARPWPKRMRTPAPTATSPLEPGSSRTMNRLPAVASAKCVPLTATAVPLIMPAWGGVLSLIAMSAIAIRECRMYSMADLAS